MKKSFFLFLALILLTANAYAETATDTAETAAVPAPANSAAPAVIEAPAAPTAEVVPPASPVPAAPVAVEAPTPQAAPAAVNEPAPAAPAEMGDLENLEFVSGEVSSMDETAKTVTVKLYGETEDGKSDKVLTVKVDESTDITDGEKDRDLKSLTTGIEVDVEYDPATNKATYIFVY